MISLLRFLSPEFVKNQQKLTPLLFLPSVWYYYKERKKKINHPIMQRALTHLQNDQRVVDFCDEDVKPGIRIQMKQQPLENWIKFDLTIKGSSGKLKTTIIGDYLTHKELKELYESRDIIAKENPEEYVPIDFEAYSILDQKTK